MTSASRTVDSLIIASKSQEGCAISGYIGVFSYILRPNQHSSYAKSLIKSAFAGYIPTTTSVSRVKHMKITTALAAFLGTLLLASPVMADIYKWKDARGVTNYSAEPPANATDVVRVKVSGKMPSDSEAAVQNLEKQREDTKKAQEKEAKKPATPASTADKKTPEKYTERCKQYQDNMKTMQEHAQIRVTENNGEVRTLTDEEKQAKMDETQRQMKAFCE
jgi:hypothetical protein